MRFFLDENFPVTIKYFLEGFGHEVIRALDHYPQGTNDEILFKHAQNVNSIFLTTDKDFYHTIPFLYQYRTAAVIAITLSQPNRNKILDRLQVLLHSVDLQSNPQSVYLVSDNRIIKRE